jgi:Holliday junction DNA helicase RuvA
MIGSIKGKIIFKNEKFALVESCGIGYKIYLSSENLFTLQKDTEAFFWTHMHIREDMMDLYGFKEKEEMDFFEMLISVSGIGPKGALGIMGIANISTLKKAIATNDTSYLTKVSGIGRKTAERLVMELKDKMGEEKYETKLQEELDALEALKSLGYSQNEAREALKNVPQEFDTNQKIREALKNLTIK